jgi:hypothetical protein
VAGVGDPSSSSVGEQNASERQEHPPDGLTGNTAPVPVANGPAVSSLNASDPELKTGQAVADSGDVELLTRFLIGILLLGGDVLMERIRDVGGDLASNPELLVQPGNFDDASTRDLARYLAIGLTMRGQARLVQGVRRGLHMSLGTASWAAGWLDRATDNRLMRPVRRPVVARLRRLGRQTGQVIREGKQEEQKGKLLAQEAVFEIIDEVIEFVAENPEAADWIQQVIGGQSIGLATSVRDNARQLTAASDGLAEAMVRRILRRTPRQALPPSPLAGKPQAMYAPDTAGQMVEGHNE